MNKQLYLQFVLFQFHHLTQNMTLWLVRYSTFFLFFAWHAQGNVKKNNKMYNFWTIKMSFFGWNGEEERISEKEQPVKWQRMYQNGRQNHHIFCCCFWMTPMAFWMTPMAKGKWWISSSSWVFLRLGHCQLTSPVVVVYSSTAAVCIVYTVHCTTSSRLNAHCSK